MNPLRLIEEAIVATKLDKGDHGRHCLRCGDVVDVFVSCCLCLSNGFELRIKPIDISGILITYSGGSNKSQKKLHTPYDKQGYIKEGNNKF